MISKETREHFYVLLLFLLLTIFLTYPVIFKISTHIAGDGGDGWQNIWNLWWAKKALLEGKNIYYTDYQFYPIGESLAFHTLTLYNTLLSVPLQTVFGNLVLVYNILFLLSFVLSGYGMFLLIKYIVGHKGVAIVSGIAYAFSPYHLAQALGHLNLLSIQWIPFYILFLAKTVREKDKKNPVLAGFFLLLISLSSWQYMVSSLIFTLIYLSYVLLSEKRAMLNRMFLKKLLLLIAVFAISVLPFAYPMIGEYFSKDYMKGATSVSFSYITPKSYILPSPLHPLFKESVKNAFYSSNLSDSVVFLGYTVLLVSLFYLMNNFRKIKFWIFSAFLFFVLSLNPNTAFFGALMPLHDLLRSFFPFFSVINNLERFAVMVVLSAIVIFSFGLRDIISKIKSYKILIWKKKIESRLLFLLLVSALIVFEFYPVPYLTTDAGVPSVLNGIGNDNGDYAILDIPPFPNTRAMYFQTIHNKKILGGFNSRTPPSSLEHLEELEKKLDSVDSSGILGMLQKDNVRYIIFYKYMSGKNNIDLSELPKKLPVANIFENDEIILYEIERG